MNNTAVCLMGPTASGKTDHALHIATQGPFEIINVDPAQMVRGMDIGSGKPDLSIRTRIPHHLMDILDPKQPYSAGQFCTAAINIMHDITARGKIPLLVGGSMMYFRALQQGLSPLPPASDIIRAQITARGNTEGWDVLHAELLQADPNAADYIRVTDLQRIQRALEIIEITGKSPSFWREQPIVPPPFRFVNIALMPLEDNRAVLHDRIAQRFDQMLSQGLIEEVRQLWDYVEHQPDLPAMRAVGYRQVIEYLCGRDPYEIMRDKAIAATRQLAKRQLTWLRHWKDCIYRDFENKNPLFPLLQEQGII